MKTMYLLVYYHNGFVATHALGTWVHDVQMCPRA